MKQLKKFKHVILTRYNWDNEYQDFYRRKDADKWMDERYELFKETRKSVLSQGVDFEWILSFDEDTPKAYVKKVCKAKMTPIFYDIREHKFNAEEPWLITTRLDNDDRLLPGALQAVQDAFQEELMMIDMHYEQLDLNTGKRYTNGNKERGEKYRSVRNSPFLSLVERSVWAKGALCRPHQKIYDGYPTNGSTRRLNNYVKVGDTLTPYALMVVHGDNVANKITGYEIIGS
jgi:hypothetical protein